MHKISIQHLKQGIFYLARDKNHEKYHYEGTFDCIYKPGPFAFAQFKDTKSNSGTKLPLLQLSEYEFMFFEKDAVYKAYTNSVLRKITGDSDIFHFYFPKK